MAKNIRTVFDEFSRFILERNALDMALGIILGVSFGKVVSALVDDIITPPLGYLLGGVSFPNLKLIIKHATATDNEIAIMYGHFLQTVIDFFIIAFTAFLIIKFINVLLRSKRETSLDWTAYIHKK